MRLTNEEKKKLEELGYSEAEIVENSEILKEILDSMKEDIQTK